MHFADRLKDIEPFRVVEVLTRARELQAQGHDVVHLEAGEPDFSTVEPVVQAAKQALANGHTYYSQAAGLPELRQALSEFYASEYGLEISPSRIMITPGASGALLLLSALLMNPGDGMLMTDPGYPCNRHFLRLVEGEGQLVPVTAEERYQLNVKNVAEHWQENTVGVMAASPANPSGETLSGDELKALADFVRSKNGVFIVDEIYHGLNYEGRAASVLEVADDAFVINSFSKYFGMTGWRLGWLVAPEEAVPHLEKLAQNLFISMSTFSQFAVLEAFKTETRDMLDERREVFKQRRDYLYQELSNLGFDIPHKPSGAFYLYANIDKFIGEDESCFAKNSQEFCLNMLEQHHIAITPGADFGRFGAENHVRFAYTTSMEQMQKAIERMKKIF